MVTHSYNPTMPTAFPLSFSHSFRTGKNLAFCQQVHWWKCFPRPAQECMDFSTSVLLGKAWMRFSLVWMRSSLVWMRSSLVWMRSSRAWMRSSLVWMRSSLVVRASDRQCRSRNSHGFDPSSSDTVESEERQMKQC